MKAWTEMTEEERAAAAAKGDAVPLMPADDGEKFNAFAELAKWRRWAVQLLGSDGFQGDRDLRTRIAEGADADQLAELRLALRDVPPGGASSDAPAWIVRLHRAACEVAGIETREAVDAPGTVGIHLAAYLNSVEGQEQFRRDTEGKPSAAPSAVHGEAISHALPCPRGDGCAQPAGHGDLCRKADGTVILRMTAIASVASLRAPVSTTEPPETPHPHDQACSRCRTQLMFSARARGDGLCGPCHRKATGTQGLVDRCRDAGIEPSLVLEILRSPEGRAAIRFVLANEPPFDAIPDDALRPGDTWRDPEGTEYVVVPAGEVGDRSRWLVGERTTPHHLSGLRSRADLHRKPPVYHPYVLVEKRPAPVEVDDAASAVPPGSVGIAFAAYLRSPEAREVLGLTPDPRIGRLARLNTERRTVARVVAIEVGGALRLREDGWDPVMQDYRARPDDVEWVNEVVA